MHEVREIVKSELGEQAFGQVHQAIQGTQNYVINELDSFQNGTSNEEQKDEQRLKEKMEKYFLIMWNYSNLMINLAIVMGRDDSLRFLAE